MGTKHKTLQTCHSPTKNEYGLELLVPTVKYSILDPKPALAKFIVPKPTFQRKLNMAKFCEFNDLCYLTNKIKLIRSTGEDAAWGIHSADEFTSKYVDCTDAQVLPYVARKNKLILVLLELFALGCCGVDRCYMGQYCCGVVKALTLGGLCVWSLIDMIVIYTNAIEKLPKIDSLGYKFSFDQDTVEPAFVAAIVGVVLFAFQILCGPSIQRRYADVPMESAKSTSSALEIELKNNQQNPDEEDSPPPFTGFT